MQFRLIPTVEAASNLSALETNPALKTQCKAVKKALGHMETNLKHPGLRTHKHTESSKQHGFEIFESYAQNNTPGAYRTFWRYEPNEERFLFFRLLNIRSEYPARKLQLE